MRFKSSALVAVRRVARPRSRASLTPNDQFIIDYLAQRRVGVAPDINKSPTRQAFEVELTALPCTGDEEFPDCFRVALSALFHDAAATLPQTIFQLCRQRHKK